MPSPNLLHPDCRSIIGVHFVNTEQKRFLIHSPLTFSEAKERVLDDMKNQNIAAEYRCLSDEGTQVDAAGKVIRYEHYYVNFKHVQGIILSDINNSGLVGIVGNLIQ